MGARSGYVARGGVGTANASIALKLPFWGVGREACKRLLATLPTEALWRSTPNTGPRTTRSMTPTSRSIHKDG